MGSSSREEITAAFAALDTAVDEVVGLDFDALTTPEWLALLQRIEQVRRRLPVAEHPLINNLARQATPEELGGTLPHTLAQHTLISRTEATRRIHEATDLGPRHGLTGEPLTPALPATAAAQKAGQLGAEQIRVIRAFYHHLPRWIDNTTRTSTETHLATLGTQHRPEHLTKLANKLMDCLNPDGDYTDEDRARRRGLTLSKQDVDGMSRLTGYLTPEARATLEAIWAKLAAPGMANPTDDTACIDGTPPEEVAQRDTRSSAQRQHDGLNAALRAILASGKLGQHNGLPTTIIVTTTLTDLEAATGRGLTGGGTRLPMSDVIRLARHAHHYLAIFDKSKPIALHHTKRLASPGQRIVLYAKDRGCTAPGCDVPGYHCEVHHVAEWATTHTTHTTNINQLTLTCKPHHRLIKPGGWTTHTNKNSDTQWTPPPHHPNQNQPHTNTYWHREETPPQQRRPRPLKQRDLLGLRLRGL